MPRSVNFRVQSTFAASGSQAKFMNAERIAGLRSFGGRDHPLVIIWGVQHSLGAVTSIVVSIWGVQHSRGFWGS